MNRHGATTKSYLNQPLLLFTTHNQQQVDIKKLTPWSPSCQLPAASILMVSAIIVFFAIVHDPHNPVMLRGARLINGFLPS
jgi:hypothetical protein